MTDHSEIIATAKKTLAMKHPMSALSMSLADAVIEMAETMQWMYDNCDCMSHTCVNCIRIKPQPHESLVPEEKK